MGEKLTRRSFLVGGVATGALGLVGLAGCTPAGGTSSTPSSGDAGGDAAQAASADGDRPWEIYPGDIAESDIA